MPSRRQVLKIGGSVLLAGLAGCAQSPTAASPEPSNSTSPSRTPTAPSDATSESVYTQVYQETIGSVVLVKTEQGQGSGFMFSESHIVTNAHVAGQATSVDIRFHEGQWSRGDVVGTDAHSDLAAIAVEEVPSSATPLSFIETPPVVGQQVVAIGNPYNLNGSLTTGIVSGTDRAIPAPTGFRIPDAIQTDAAVNPGNSGGPLMSLDGRVMAVINSGGGENIAFGISAALTQRVVPRLIETGDYNHAYMGISFTDVTPTIAEANGLSEPRGLLVVEVVAGGPANGVLQPSDEIQVVDGERVPVGGDVLLAVDGTQLETSEDLMSYLALQTRPGETVELEVLRDSRRQPVELELGSRPEPTDT